MKREKIEWTKWDFSSDCPIKDEDSYVVFILETDVEEMKSSKFLTSVAPAGTISWTKEGDGYDVAYYYEIGDNWLSVAPDRIDFDKRATVSILEQDSDQITTYSKDEWCELMNNVVALFGKAVNMQRVYVRHNAAEIALSDLILECAEELKNENGGFSIWEITKRIRRKMENGTYVGDSPKHLDVKNCFLSMQWTDYDISTRNHGTAEYRYYEHNPTHAVAPVVPDEEEEIDINFNSLLSYIHGRSNAPTMKQIQSRFKKGTCKAWVELCRKAGIQLIDSKHPSKVKVKDVA